MADILAAFSESDLISFREDVVAKAIAAIEISPLKSLPQLQNMKQSLETIAALISDIESFSIARLRSHALDPLLMAVDGADRSSRT